MSAANVCRVRDNTINRDKIPIIFVPGVMGSRLVFDGLKGDLQGGKPARWDPDNKDWKGPMYQWATNTASTNYDQLVYDKYPATVSTTGDKITYTQQECDRGWAGVSAEFYLQFLKHFHYDVKSLCADTPVHAVGYDWRQSNNHSAVYLDATIKDILDKKEKGAKQFILISHSMGGLVTRAYMNNTKLKTNAQVLAAIHVAQPALGAAVFYRRMYTGWDKQYDGDSPLKHIMGQTGQRFAILLAAMPGPCELMPNNDYRDMPAPGSNTLSPWLIDDRHKAVKPPAQAPAPRPWVPPIYPWYNNQAGEAGPPSILQSLQGKSLSTYHDALRTGITGADAFHKALGSFKHPNTWTIYGSNMNTDMAASFVTDPGVFSDSYKIVPRMAPQGDGTVPETSAKSLFTEAETAEDDSGKIFTRDGTKRQARVTGVDHAGMFGAPKVLAILEQMLFVALNCVCPPQVSGPSAPTASNASTSSVETVASAPPTETGQAAFVSGNAPDAGDWDV